MTTGIRELNSAELELIAGARNNDYKFCWYGPAGEGLYPWYTPCGTGSAYGAGDLANDMAASIAGATQ